jgi:hypothetical protein
MAHPRSLADATAVGHVNAIDVVSVGQGLFEQVSGQTKGVGCEVTVTKQLDSAGPLLWMAALGKDVVPEARVSVEEAGEKPLTTASEEVLRTFSCGL